MSTPAVPMISGTRHDPAVKMMQQSNDAAVRVMQPPVLAETGAEQSPDPWSGLARVIEAAAPPEPESAAEPEHAAEPTRAPELAATLARLADELTDERRLRAVAEDGRRVSEVRAHAAEAEAARLRAQVTAGQTRTAELERDRDDVIHRAEELLTAVRERADQRLAEERQRADAMAARVQDAWLAAAVLRRARPLRPRSSTPTTVTAVEQEVLEALDENETDPALAAESPELAGEIEQLRQRLRSRLHKPADIPTVEDSVEDLRVARLARDSEPAGRRRN